MNLHKGFDEYKDKHFDFSPSIAFIRFPKCNLRNRNEWTSTRYLMNKDKNFDEINTLYIVALYTSKTTNV